MAYWFPSKGVRGRFDRMGAALGLLLMAVGWHAALLAAEAKPAAAKSGSAEKIQITADRLVAETQNRFADFIGAVKVVQGDTVIICDKLRIVYDSQKAGADADPQQGAIKRLEAEGNVRIDSQNKQAFAPKAIYDPTAGVVILSGAGSRVSDGPNSITGDKITLYRNEDRMVVEGGRDRRVEAVVFPENKSAP